MARKGRARRFREARALKQGAYAGESDFESILGESDIFSTSHHDDDDDDDDTDDPYDDYSDDPYAEYYNDDSDKDDE
ncbi:MAG: hypothetical protein KAZ88_08930 [Acidimicrobiia bacterium]|jgi:hypothetical protein|nr:hypothetical protein [Acidimicrobiia bacterium]MBP8181101.1 hypothetical protein [Acidimicrobiia bacterium]